MWLFLDLIISGVGGFVAHFARFVTEDILKLKRGWIDLTHYAIGVIFVLPFSLLVSERIMDVVSLPECKRRDDVKKWFKVVYIIVYFISFVSFGIGNVIAWLSVTYFDRRENDE